MFKNMKHGSMHDKTTTIQLLKYYSQLAMHHRIMMIGFVTIYFGINQALLLAPLDSLELKFTEYLAFIISAGLIVTFTLSGALHHACHFCSTGSMKANMLADIHYQQMLQEPPNDNDTFLKWINNSALRSREALAVRSPSVYILGTLFTLLTITNGLIFLDVAYDVLKEKPIWATIIFYTFVLFQLVALVYYGWKFMKHFQSFIKAGKELELVLISFSRDEVDKKIKDLKGCQSSSSPFFKSTPFNRRRRASDKKH